MGLPFIGEIRSFAFEAMPKGWHLCDGTILPVLGNEPLFSLLSNRFGGDGKTTFALPDLRGRVPRMAETFHYVGRAGGQAEVSLASTDIPVHAHAARVTTQPGTSGDPQRKIPAATPPLRPIYAPSGGAQVTLNQGSVGVEGEAAGIANMQPYLVVNFCIALQGIFPGHFSD